MEYFPITKTDAGFHIEGFPDAVKVFRINGPLAKQLADLSLHKGDLVFAAECLGAINHASDKPSILRQALWRSAIVHYFKCFGNSTRSQLSSDKIYKGNELALIAFKYFKDLRNKHFVHDENSYAQSIPGAILNKPDKSHKIEKIICLNAIGETLDENNYGNLDLLIQTARKWVVGKFDSLCEIITKELEAKSYQDLYNREAINYSVPSLDDIKKNRNSI